MMAKKGSGIRLFTPAGAFFVEPEKIPLAAASSSSSNNNDVVFLDVEADDI